MSRNRRFTVTALLIASAFALSACGSDDAPPSTPDASSSWTEEETAAQTPQPAPEDDTSIVDFLRAAGVDDALVNRLGEVGDANGYGLGEGTETDLDQRRSLATTQVDTCRDVAVGHRSWKGVRSSDVGGGAGEEEAAAMAEFLRTEFCPHVKPLKEAPLPEQTLGGTEQDARGGRGLGSPLSWWDARYQRVSWSRACAAATGQPTGEPVAYRLTKDAVACASVPHAEGFKGHLVNVDVVFASPVDEARARDAALALLPTDAELGEQAEGVNPDWSPQEGGCLSVDFRTQRLKRVMAELKKDPEPGAHALYYSDGATYDGATSPYTGTVRQMLLSTGPNEAGATGDLTC